MEFRKDAKMKSWLWLFFLLPCMAWAEHVDFVIDSDGVKFPKWKLGDDVIWTDADRDRIIEHGSRSTKTITTADFTPYPVDSDTIALSTSAFKHFGGFTRRQAENVIYDKEKLKGLMLDLAMKMSALANAQAAWGDDYSKEIREIQSLGVFIQRRIKALP